METYIALLRGINVGGKNKIKMADLKAAMEALGLAGVQTYIQSGNVVFRSAEKEASLRSRIEQKLAADFAYPARVNLRTANEIESLIKSCPFTGEEILKTQSMTEAESFYVCFLSEVPSSDKIERIKPYINDADQCKIAGRDVYLLFSHSIRDSKLAAKLQLLDEAATTRNFNTVQKLYEMTKAIQ